MESYDITLWRVGCLIVWTVGESCGNLSGLNYKRDDILMVIGRIIYCDQIYRLMLNVIVYKSVKTSTCFHWMHFFFSFFFAIIQYAIGIARIQLMWRVYLVYKSKYENQICCEMLYVTPRSTKRISIDVGNNSYHEFYLQQRATRNWNMCLFMVNLGWNRENQVLCENKSISHLLSKYFCIWTLGN